MYLYSSYQLERGAKRYELANHLGNVLTVISDKKTANFTGSTFTHFTAERISATDYSPFGAPLAGRTWNGGEYRFGFNSMEKDNEINGTGNAYDFGARVYDSRLGRWMSVDPLQVDYQFISPYSFCLNSPITSVDPDGKKVVVVRKPNQGKEGRDLVLITIDAKWIDKSGKKEALRTQQKKVEEINEKESRKYKRQNKKLERMTLEYNAYAQSEMEELKNSIESTFQGMDEHTEWKTEFNISDGSFNEIKNTDHAFYAVIEVNDAAARANILGGLVVYYSPGYVEGYSSTKVKTHDTGHFLGLLHCYENFFNGKRATEYNKTIFFK